MSHGEDGIMYPKQLCHDLNFSWTGKRCHSIIYNRYQIDGKFQKRLSKIPKIYPIAISHECWADIFGKLNILRANKIMTLFPDGRATRQIDCISQIIPTMENKF